jgi:hypothetical protein
MRRVTLLSPFLLGSALALAETPDKQPLSDRERAAAQGAKEATFTLPADAPRPPAEKIKKTQPTEIAKHPGKTPITAFENLVYQLQKPEASIWSYLSVGEGSRVPAPSSAVLKQVADLRVHLEAVRAADPSWHRLGEYEQLAAFFEHVIASQQAYSEGLVAARKAAADEAAAAYDAAWAAKRSQDEGMLHAFHEANARKLVFSGSALAANNAAPAALDRVEADAPLFARAYLAESGWNAMNSAGVDCGSTGLSRYRFTTYVTIGSDQYEVTSFRPDKATFQAATTVDLAPSGSLTAGGAFSARDEDSPAFRWLALIAPRLQDGDNALRWEVRAWCDAALDNAGVAVASGELTVRASAASRETLSKRGTFALAPSVHPATAIAGQRAKVDAWAAGRGQKLLDFRTASEWEPVRHALSGQITHRSAGAVALVREQSGTQCYLISLSLEEPYDGQKYGPALNFGVVSPRPFVCQAR